MIIEFDANTDSDTFINVFGHLAKGYVIEVNGIDMVCQSVWSDGDSVGLFGYEYDPGADFEFHPDKPIGFEWDEIEKVVIY